MMVAGAEDEKPEIVMLGVLSPGQSAWMCSRDLMDNVVNTENIVL